MRSATCRRSATLRGGSSSRDQAFATSRAASGRPIWMHPYFNPAHTSTEYGLPLSIEQVFGWPFDSTVAMTSLIFGGVLDRFPGLSFITHHAGALIPFFEQRIVTHLSPEA